MTLHGFDHHFPKDSVVSFAQSITPWTLRWSSSNQNIKILSHVPELYIVELTTIISKECVRSTEIKDPVPENSCHNLLCLLGLQHGTDAVPCGVIYHMKDFMASNFLDIHGYHLVKLCGKW